APECHRASRPVPIGPAFSIVFEDVSLNYPSGRTALRGLDLRVEPGERVALVGHSGAGKTSVFNLLLGFATPDSGSVRVNGTPIERIDLDLWRRQIAWVPQHSHIFHGTLRENILLGLTDTPNARIEQALEMAGADEFVRLLPEGLDTVVGERGQGLSGGQMRRIALARAFVRDAPLVLLDEATASLDQATEAVVSRAVERLARQRTVLVITHRLRTVRDADRIVVLEHGRVVEEGSHDSLLARGGLYSKLARRSSNLS
ncbi:MAG: ABC transporter ATP-binding protein, partial [Proteobacteria bacterium]